jgi:hypothetical protein
MIKKITIDKNILPLFLEVDFKTFSYHYVLAKKNKSKQSINKLFSFLLPTFNKWNIAYKHNIYSDITIYTLFRLLEADTTFVKGFTSLFYFFNLYLIKNNLTFLDIIFEAFINHINKHHQYISKKYTNQKTLEFFIANEIKMFIFTSIRSYAAEARRNPIYHSSLLDELSSEILFEEDLYIDYDILNSIDEGLYRAYFINALLGNYSPTLDNNFKRTKQSIQNKDTLCHLIKQMPLNN